MPHAHPLSDVCTGTSPSIMQSQPAGLPLTEEPAHPEALAAGWPVVFVTGNRHAECTPSDDGATELHGQASTMPMASYLPLAPAIHLGTELSQWEPPYSATPVTFTPTLPLANMLSSSSSLANALTPLPVQRHPRAHESSPTELRTQPATTGTVGL